MRARTTRVAAATLAVLGLAVMGCTEQKAETGTGGTSAGGGPATTDARNVATGEPIKIGYANQDTGPAALPQVTRGAELAAMRVNEFEGGINGRPIELVTCSTDGTPEGSTACANRFVSEGVVAVVDGADLGTDAKIPILSGAGIPTMGPLTLGTSQSLNQDAFFYAPASTTFPTAMVDLAAAQGAKKLAVIFPDVSQVPILTDLSEKQAQINGVELEVIKFDEAAPDFAAAIAAAQSNGADAIITISTDEWCNGLVRAAQAANFTGKMVLGQCIDFVDEFGADKVAGTYLVGTTWGPLSQPYAPPEAQEVLDDYRAAMEADGKGDQVNGLAAGGYIAIVQTADILRTLPGELTAASVMSAMRALKDGPNRMGQPITCDPRPAPGFAGCAKGWQWYQLQPDGTAKPISNGFVEVKT